MYSNYDMYDPYYGFNHYGYRSSESTNMYSDEIITTIFSYDENVKSSNNKGFLLQTI